MVECSARDVSLQLRAIATPDVIQWANGLPKTRSGKIMRRILHKFASDEDEQLADVSSLADPAVVIRLAAEHRR